MALDYFFSCLKYAFVNTDLIWDSLVTRYDANDPFIDQIIRTVKMIISNDLPSQNHKSEMDVFGNRFIAEIYEMVMVFIRL